MLTVIVIITVRSMCGVNSYCENTDNNGEIYMRANSYCDNNGRHMCSVSSYCNNIDNNKEIYMQC